MSHGNQSYLRFSLEESVWFQKGQEVDELISISLDPNITLNESDQYLTIKGSLELSGEFNRDENERAEEEENDYFSSPKFIQIIEAREEGVSLFSHHFPVEITIPKNRIQNIDEIDVSVETFDYAFPEKSCLRLSADLIISGLYGEQQHDLTVEQEENEVEEIPDYQLSYRIQPVTETEEDIEDEKLEIHNPFERPVFKEDNSDALYTPFEVEGRKEPQPQVEYNSPVVEEEREEIVIESQQISVEEEREEVVIESQQIPVEEELEPQPPEIEEPVQKRVPEIIFATLRNEGNNASGEETVDENVNQEDGENEEEESPEEVESSSSAEPKVKKKKWKKKQSLTITEFLARKEEESHTRVKVCIVQKGDTIEQLSERYDVPTSHLQKVNHLELNQDVYEGQVLYIPIAQTQK